MPAGNPKSRFLRAFSSLTRLRMARNDKVVDAGELRAGKTNSRFLHSGRDDTVVGTRGEFLDGPEGVTEARGPSTVKFVREANELLCSG